jgi:hypothetical protein
VVQTVIALFVGGPEGTTGRNLILDGCGAGLTSAGTSTLRTSR